MKQFTPYESNIIKSYAQEFGCTEQHIKAVLHDLHMEAIYEDYGSFQAWEQAWERLPYTLQND